MDWHFILHLYLRKKIWQKLGVKINRMVGNMRETVHMLVHQTSYGVLAVDGNMK